MNLPEEKFVGIRMGLLGAPEEAFHVNGRIKVGYNNEPATAGTMRYNTDTNAFEGYNGTIWQSFGGGGSLIDEDLDTYIELAEASYGSIKFIANSDGIMAFDGHRLTLGKDGTQ